MAKDTFTVVYRTGGTEVCKWHECVPVSTMEKALELRDDCARMGYKAIIHKTSFVRSNGLPEGWDA